MTTVAHTWADLEAVVGQDFSGGARRTAADPVEWGTIRRFCEPIELGAPIHYDESVAKQYGYPGVVLPISAVNSTFTSGPVWSPGDPTRWDLKDPHATYYRAMPRQAAVEMPKPETTGGFATDIEIEYLRPVCIGDRLTTYGRKLLSVNLRETSVGYGAFTVSESYIENQRGELVAIQRNGGYAYNPHSPEKLAELRAARSSSSRSGGAAAAPELIAPTQPRSDWSQTLYWDDVKEGDEVPPVSLVVTVQRLVIEAGGNRDFQPIHHDTVLTQKSGVEEMYMNNVFIQATWERTVREYIGVGGRIRKVGPFRMNIFNQAGFTVVTQGKVTKKWQQDGENWVELNIVSVNDRGVGVGPGPVTVTLPSRP